MNMFNAPRSTYPEDALAYMLIDRGTIDARLEEVNGWEYLFPAERTFAYVYTLFVEICNGGFKQFLWNPSGIHTREILQSLKSTGFTTTADLLEQAIRPFPKVFDYQDEELRHFVVDGAKEDTNELWERLNEKYFQSDDYSRFYDILSDFVTANIREFPAAAKIIGK